jgi:hypothetical protein
MKKSEVKALLATKKFVKNVQLKTISGIDYLVIGDNAQAIKSWPWVADQVNSLDVIPEVYKGGELTDDELAVK